MKYQIAIDLTPPYFDCEIENEPLLESPKFDTEKEADDWYRGINILSPNLDIIMVIWNEKGEMVDTYVY